MDNEATTPKEAEPESEDTEGSAFRGSVQPAGETDDTEGHSRPTGSLND